MSFVGRFKSDMGSVCSRAKGAGRHVKSSSVYLRAIVQTVGNRTVCQRPRFAGVSVGYEPRPLVFGLQRVLIVVARCACAIVDHTAFLSLPPLSARAGDDAGFDAADLTLVGDVCASNSQKGRRCKDSRIRDTRLIFTPRGGQRLVGVTRSVLRLAMTSHTPKPIIHAGRR